jgi:hypothetical protein
MGELKRRRQALTAAVYGEARVESFDGKVLRLVYPEEQSFHVGMARDQGHLAKLGSVLEERLGSKPHLEVRAAGGEAATLVEEPAQAPMEPRAPEPREPEPRPAFEEAPAEPAISNGAAGPDTQNRGSEPQASGEDGVIQNEREVFDIAREHNLFGENDRG